MQTHSYWKLTAAALLALAETGMPHQTQPIGPGTSSISAETRAELLAARDSAWRAFFTKDPAQLEQLLGPELIAIQQGQNDWQDRTQLMKLAEVIQQQNVEITRLEFPRTEIQLFGDVAILYYTYVFGNAAGGRSAIHSGRGTEIFVRRNQRWVDVGWHLDHGAFRHRNGVWERIAPEPEAPSSDPEGDRH